ncbi:MAG: PEGA domain-containing protein [Candidatus Brocadiia bacterium]
MRVLARICMALVLVGVGTGCVRRELQIDTTPPGATVEIDGVVLEEATPVRLPFWWYGTHELVVTKEGYQRQIEIAHLRPPWYEHFPIDFFADCIIPWTIKDIHRYAFALQKEESKAQLSDAEKEALKSGLLHRAEQFRSRARPAVGLPAHGEEAPEKTEEE